MNVLGVEPPLLPLRCEIRSDANITYAGFKLDTIMPYVIGTKRRKLTHTSGKKSSNDVNGLGKGTHRGPSPSCLDQGHRPRRERGHPTLDPE